MNYHHEISSNVDAKELEQRITNFLLTAGYEQSDNDKSLFTRGSFLRSMVSFTPKSWKTKVTIAIIPVDAYSSKAKVDCDINTTGQTILPKELEFWQVEHDDLRATATNGEINLASEQASKATVKHIWKLVGIMALSMLVCTMIAVLAMRNQTAVYAGIFVGGVVGYALGQNV